MNKKSKSKRKITGFDIMYRVITAALAIAMFPTAYFMNIIYIEVNHSGIGSLIGGLLGSNALQGSTYLNINLSRLDSTVDLISSYLGESGNFSLSSLLSNTVYRPVIAAAVLLAIALVVGLVILGFALFSNMSKVITALSASGLLLTAASYISFTKFFADPVLTGKITLAQLVGIEDDIGSIVTGLIGSVSSLHLDSAFFAVLFLMLGIFLWSAAVLIVNSGDKKDVKEKKVKKANA